MTYSLILTITFAKMKVFSFFGYQVIRVCVQTLCKTCKSFILLYNVCCLPWFKSMNSRLQRLDWKHSKEYFSSYSWLTSGSASLESLERKVSLLVEKGGSFIEHEGQMLCLSWQHQGHCSADCGTLANPLAHIKCSFT